MERKAIDVLVDEQLRDEREVTLAYPTFREGEAAIEAEAEAS